MYNVANISKEGEFMTLGEYMVSFREDHKLTQRQFANMCDLSNTYIKVIEENYNPKTGKPPVLSLATIRKIAVGMGMSLQSLTDIIENDYVSSVDEAVLSEDERDLLMFYRDMSLNDKHFVLSLVRKIVR